MRQACRAQLRWGQVWALMRPIASEAMTELVEEHLGARWFDGLLTELIMPEIPHIITGRSSW